MIGVKKKKKLLKKKDHQRWGYSTVERLKEDLDYSTLPPGQVVLKFEPPKTQVGQ